MGRPAVAKHQEGETEMARTNRIKVDGDAHYHVMSRTNGKRMLFERGKVKTALVDALRRAAAFSGVELKAYAAMGNHFHAVVKVTKPDAPVGAEELLRRVGVLKGERERLMYARRWERLALAGDGAALAAEQDRLRVRMHDVSEFVKTFKEEFGRAYKRNRPYCGSIWSGRFTSTLIEDGAYLARCKRYVIYNPVRAGLVTQSKDYPWCWCEADEPFSSEGSGSGGSAAGVQRVEADGADSTGPVPAGWWLRRVAQIGAGKVFGSAGFVLRTAAALGPQFRSRGVGAHPVGEIGYSTHGWRLAKEAEKSGFAAREVA